MNNLWNKFLENILWFFDCTYFAKHENKEMIKRYKFDFFNRTDLEALQSDSDKIFGFDWRKDLENYKTKGARDE